jgi:hypothetical protein
VTWTILIPTLGQRRDLLARLLDVLMPQLVEGVDVLACWDNGETALSRKRQALVEAATGEYVCFIDDDDLVKPDYVSSIVAAIKEHPDYVGFLVDVYRDGEFYGAGSHSLEWGGWFTRPDGLMCRDVTHRNPMLKRIALTADFEVTPRGGSEDEPWANQLRGRLQSQVMVPRVLYDLLWVPAQTAWDDPDRKVRPVDAHGRPWARIDVGSDRFAWLEV